MSSSSGAPATGDTATAGGCGELAPSGKGVCSVDHDKAGGQHARQRSPGSVNYEMWPVTAPNPESAPDVRDPFGGAYRSDPAAVDKLWADSTITLCGDPLAWGCRRCRGGNGTGTVDEVIEQVAAHRTQCPASATTADDRHRSVTDAYDKTFCIEDEEDWPCEVVRLRAELTQLRNERDQLRTVASVLLQLYGEAPS